MPKIALITLGLLAVVLGLTFTYRTEELRWRLQVVANFIAGEINEVPALELIDMLMPGSPIYIEELVRTPNPYAVIVNPYVSSADVAQGKQLFESKCAGCHNQGAHAGAAPNLFEANLKYGESDYALFSSIRDGIPVAAMPSLEMEWEQRWQIVGYISQMRTKAVEAAGSFLAQPFQVPFERIVDAEAEPENWLTYSGNLNGHRHTALTGFEPERVSDMALDWVAQTRAETKIEASPIVVNGSAYVTLPNSVVMALDARNGRELWRWVPQIDRETRVCCGNVNRGVAVLNGLVFVATLDGRLVALDGSSGTVVWERTVALAVDGYSITVAPLAVEDKVIVGVSGGEFGIRGFVSAYLANTGEPAWRFHTIPAPGEPGGDSWPDGDSWERGGGPTWVTGSYDPNLRLLYWGVGNPSPDFDGSVREGDNLYTNSILALSVDDGELMWHFQFVPHDVHDRAASQVPVLVDNVPGYAAQPLLLAANRNGFFYVLNRASGEYLGSTEFARQNWALLIDQSGRPVPNPLAQPTERGTLVWPGAAGATNWWPPSYDPMRRLLVVPTLDRPSIYFLDRDAPFVRGEQYLGGSSITSVADSRSYLIAIDPTTREVVWRTLVSEGVRDFLGGAMTTRGGVTFAGVGDRFVMFDTATGKILHSIRLGGALASPPVAYRLDDKNFVIISAGSNIFAFSVEI